MQFKGGSIEVVGFILGALIITLALTRITNWIFKKKMDHGTAAIVSFLIVGLSILLLKSNSMSLAWAFIFYMPWLILWLIIDLYKSSRFNCPYCGEKIKKVALICKHCGKDLNMST